MSTNNNEQNGRQPPLSNQPPPTPSDPRLGNVSDQQPICRKYLWGTCTKIANCKFRHELDLDEMKKTLKFCHDYQNKQGCTRVDCTYLHTTREEQNLFLATGQLPRVLAERYAAMSDAPNCMPSFEGAPQMALYPAPPPPPPPPAPLPTVAAPPPPPPPHPVQAFPPVQQPPPPPPPPTVPSTAAVRTAPIFSAPPPQNVPVAFPLNQPPPPLPPMFDASRPPPPLPNRISAHKRQLDRCEAGPSKVRKTEAPKVADDHCENCVQRELRIDMYKQQMEKLHCEGENQSLAYKKKLEEYENRKEILRRLVSPELYRILEDYIEDGPPQVQDILAQFSQPSFLSNTSSLSKHLMLSILDRCSLSHRSLADSAPSSSVRLNEPLLQSLSSLSRRTNQVSHSSNAELVHALLEIFRNSSAPDRSQTIESRSNDVRNTDGSRTNLSSVTNSVNGFNRFTNGQKAGSSAPAPATSSMRYPSAPPAPARTYLGADVPGPSGLSRAPRAAVAPAPVYATYHPGIPPPVYRPYYTQQYGPTSSTSGPVPSTSYNNAPRGGAAPMPVRSATSAAPSMPPNVQNYSQYMMGRYPHPPHYDPPFQ